MRASVDGTVGFTSQAGSPTSYAIVPSEPAPGAATCSGGYSGSVTDGDPSASGGTLMLECNVPPGSDAWILLLDTPDLRALEAGASVSTNGTLDVSSAHGLCDGAPIHATLSVDTAGGAGDTSPAGVSPDFVRAIRLEAALSGPALTDTFVEFEGQRDGTASCQPPFATANIAARFTLTSASYVQAQREVSGTCE